MLIGKHGSDMNLEKDKALQTRPKPRFGTEDRGFLGLWQFFRLFVPNFAKIANLVTYLTKMGQECMTAMIFVIRRLKV